MKPLITAILLLFSLACFAQNEHVFFLTNDGRYLQKHDSADYMRIVIAPNSDSPSLYQVFEYYPGKKKKLTGLSSQLNPPVFEGSCMRYYENGKPQSITTYKNGVPVGDEFDFYRNGKLYRQIENLKDENNQHGAYNINYNIISENDTSGAVLVTDGNGYYKGYDKNFEFVIDEGKVKNGKRDSVWTGEDSRLNITFKEVYNNGELISGTASSPKNFSTSYTGSREVMPQYPGGKHAFSDFLSKNLYYPAKDKYSDIQGTVILTFVVETDGSISDIKVIKKVSDSLDQAAIEVLNKSGNWTPGTLFGRRVRVTQTIPISFHLND